jgi:ABC-2 type transport system ATP-binding protein
LALATAIVHKPKVLFLDEPTSGVDPTARRIFWDLIYEMVDDGVTAFVTTHYMDEAEYCQRVGIMRRGQLLAIDKPTTLKNEGFSGQVWDIFTDHLLDSLTILENHSDIIRAGLAGNHLRIITTTKVTAKKIKIILKGFADEKFHIEKTQPSLEDVFLTLAG